jgi:hypothetical protein
MPTSITSSGITFDDATTLTTGVVPTANIANGAVTPAKLSQPFTLVASVPSTSGLAIDFTPIPSWAKRITVMFNGVSTNGTSAVQVQLGNSGGFEATGYSVSNSTITGTNAVAVAVVSTGFTISGNTAATTRDGALILSNLAGNTWVGIGSFVNAGVGHAGFTQGTKTLSATLDRIRITANGTDTFDAGTISISYEG